MASTRMAAYIGEPAADERGARDSPMRGPDGAEVAKDRLWREIGAALLLKAVALALLYFAFFDPSHRPTITPSVMTSKLFAGSDASPQ